MASPGILRFGQVFLMVGTPTTKMLCCRCACEYNSVTLSVPSMLRESEPFENRSA